MRKLVRSDEFINGVLETNIKYYKDDGDIVDLLEDLKSELCLFSEGHDEDGNLIK